MTIQQVQDTIIEEFSHLDDWLDKYELLVDLGKKHPSLPGELKTDETALRGCQSQVWITSKNTEGKIRFQADSDSMITRGILNLLLKVLNNRSPREIVSADLYFMEKIGLNTGLSPARANGLSHIIKRLRELGEAWRESP